MAHQGDSVEEGHTFDCCPLLHGSSTEDRVCLACLRLTRRTLDNCQNRRTVADRRSSESLKVTHTLPNARQFTGLLLMAPSLAAPPLGTSLSLYMDRCEHGRAANQIGGVGQASRTLANHCTAFPRLRFRVFGSLEWVPGKLTNWFEKRRKIEQLFEDCQTHSLRRWTVPNGHLQDASLPATMMPTLWKVLYALRNLLFMSVALLLCTSAVLELIFAPVMTFKYYGPSLFRTGLADSVMATFYTVCILVQLCNFLGALFLFVSILLTNYHEKWLAYDTLSLLSVAFSLSLITHHSLVGIDFYRSHVEKDIYKQVAAVGDVHCTRRACIKTDVFTWHQDSQCCGWYSSNELTGMFDPRAQERLPQFCCFQNTTQAVIKGSFRNRTASLTTSASCEQGAIHRFQEPCSKNRTAFLMFRGLTYIGHPSSLPYSVFKMLVALGYTFVKKSSLFPQTEGIYSHFVTL